MQTLDLMLNPRSGFYYALGADRQPTGTAILCDTSVTKIFFGLRHFFHRPSPNKIRVIYDVTPFKGATKIIIRNNGVHYEFRRRAWANWGRLLNHAATFLPFRMALVTEEPLTEHRIWVDIIEIK